MTRTIALGLLPALIVYAGARLGVRHIWVPVLSYYAVCLTVPAVVPHSETGLKRAARARFWIGSALLSVVLVVAIPWAGVWIHARDLLFPQDAPSLLRQLEPWDLVVLWSIVLNPWIEEYYWRGFLLPRTGVLAGGLLFAFMHFAGLAAVFTPLQAVAYALPVAGAGVFWGWLRRASGSLWPCIITHLATDAGLLLLFDHLRR
ncbi:MAG: CPBP family intramembrane metalloprotease [Planctomycetes bacterium]|nr:CPBP family intramembrane metalloprotease [Planctomycetota bacterium]